MAAKNRNRRLLLLAGLAAVICIGWWATGRHLTVEAHEANLREGTLVYSAAMGWVNLDHALPDGPAKLLEAVAKAAQEDSTGAPFTYHQQMKMLLGSTTLQMRASCTVELPVLNNEADQAAFAWELFRMVSLQFEEGQRGFPYQLYAPAAASGFRAGDLAGNQVAFVTALNNTSSDSVRAFLAPTPLRAAFGHYKNEGITSNEHWPALSAFSSAKQSPFTQLPDTRFFNQLTVLNSNTELEFI